jgi:hypothetical protein
MKKYCLVLLIILLGGCDIIYNPIHIANTKFDTLYIEKESIYSKKVLRKEGQNTFRIATYRLNIGQMSVEEADIEKANYPVIQKITFYYKDRSCLLFSYTREEIIKLKTESGFANKDHSVIFLVEQNSLTPISKKEYNKIKGQNTLDRFEKKLNCRR